MQADWLGAREAAERIVAAVGALGSTTAPLAHCNGRILAEDLVASIDLPRWTNSAMDGFAVRAVDVADASRTNPIELPVVDDIPAGAFPQGDLPPGAAARVLTGAPVPDGADSVIRVEHTDAGTGIGSGDGRVMVFDPQDAGRNLRRKGEDLRAGTVALRAGTLLSAGAVGVAASLGRAELRVIRRPLIALLTSGDELVEVDDFDEVLAGRKIVSSNSYTLAAQLAEAGCDVRYLGISPDEPGTLRRMLGEARGCDALITSAGISVGEHDHIKGVLMELGAEVAFWRVRIRPGSPFAFGTVQGLGGIPWFGLPGNPVSSMVTFEIFARPALLRMSGQRQVFRRTIEARLLDEYAAPAGLTHFVRVRLEALEDRVWGARLTGPQGSGILTSLAEADGLMIVPADQSGARRGDLLPVIPLEPSGRLMAEVPPY